MKNVSQFISTVFILLLIGYGVIHFFEIEITNLVDWIVGLSTFVWLVAIVVIPWNAHFRAKEVLYDAEISQRKNINIIDESLRYVEKVAKRSLYVAIGLHVFSAIVLLIIATMGISPVGYYGAGAALLLTLFRPTVQFYEYLKTRLTEIKKEFRMPREDVKELLASVQIMQKEIKDLESLLDKKANSGSWRVGVEQKNVDLHSKIDDLENTLSGFQKETNKEITLVKTDAKQQFDKLVADSQILESVRVLAQFVHGLNLR
jgi:hypothetical protein